MKRGVIERAICSKSVYVNAFASWRRFWSGRKLSGLNGPWTGRGRCTCCNFSPLHDLIVPSAPLHSL